MKKSCLLSPEYNEKWQKYAKICQEATGSCCKYCAKSTHESRADRTEENVAANARIHKTSLEIQQEIAEIEAPIPEEQPLSVLKTLASRNIKYGIRGKSHCTKNC